MIRLLLFFYSLFSASYLFPEDANIIIKKQIDVYEVFVEFQSVDPNENEDLAKKEAILNAKKNAFIELKSSEKFENIKISHENIDKVINSYTIEDYEYINDIVKINLKIYFNKSLIQNLNDNFKHNVKKAVSGSESISVKINISNKNGIMNKNILINFCKLSKISFKFDKIIYPNLFINLFNINKNIFIQEIKDQYSIDLENINENIYLLR